MIDAVASCVATILAVLLSLAAGAARAEEKASSIELRVATLAPEGSAWARLMTDGARKIATKTQGRVTVKYYFGGSQGSEREVVRRLRDGGKLEGAALTAIGLSFVSPELRVFELPFLFRSDTELARVRAAMEPELVRRFEEGGFVFLAWGDIGWIHVYSPIPIRSTADFTRVKIWGWNEDVVARALFKQLGIQVVPLDVPDVLPSLQNGTIDTCYNSPLAALAFGWHRHVRFAAAEPIAYGVGAILLRRDAFERLRPADQAIVREVFDGVEARLARELTKSHVTAKKALGKAGVKFVSTPPELLAVLQKRSEAVWTELAGKVYRAEVLEEVRRRLGEIRKR